jgi:hypothetical protein
MNLQPLRERTDYGVDGTDQLERQFALLSRENKNLVKDQFTNRLKDEDIINEVLVSYEQNSNKL